MIVKLHKVQQVLTYDIINSLYTDSQKKEHKTYI